MSVVVRTSPTVQRSPKQRSERVGEPLVLGLLTDAVGAARLRDAFQFGLRLLTTTEELVTVASSTLADLIVVEPRGSAVKALNETVVRLRQIRPGTAIAVYAHLDQLPLRDVLLLGAAGATYLIVRDVDDSPIVLRHLARSSASWSIAAQASSCLTTEIHEPIFSAVKYCLCHASHKPTANDVAAALGVSRRTLTNWTRRLGLRGASGLINACRAVVAICLLNKGTSSVAQVADALGFSSATHLRNTVARYAGCGVPLVRREGSVEYWSRRVIVRGNGGVGSGRSADVHIGLSL